MSVERRILLVEDEVPVRNLYQLYLERNGHVVTSTGSASEALDILERDQVALVILDIFLREDDGLKLLKTVVGDRPELPVIVISGLTYEEPRFQEALESGASGFFTKTLPLSQLLMEVRRIMKERYGR